MTDELKRQMKLIKYGRDFKLSIVVMILFVLLGIFAVVMDLGGIVQGSMEIFFGIVCLLQMEYGLMSAGLCASSPNRRVLEIWLPDLSGLVWGVLGYAVLFVFAMIEISSAPGDDEIRQLCGRQLLFAGMMGAAVIIYGSMAYKSTLISLIIYILAFCAILFCSDMDIGVDLTVGALLGLCMILAGVVLAGVLRRLLYRKPLNRSATGMDSQKQV